MKICGMRCALLAKSQPKNTLVYKVSALLASVALVIAGLIMPSSAVAVTGASIKFIQVNPGGSFNVGDTLRYNIELTAGSESGKRFELQATGSSNIDNVASLQGCRASRGPGNTILCKGNLAATHVLTAADFTDGQLTYEPYVSFKVCDRASDTDSAACGANDPVVRAPWVEAISDPQYPMELIVVNSPANGGTKWQVGEVVQFKLQVTNDDTVNHSFITSATNLQITLKRPGSEESGCRWSTFAPGTQTCQPNQSTFAYTVTEEAAATGQFEAWVDVQVRADNAGAVQQTKRAAVTLPLEPAPEEPQPPATAGQMQNAQCSLTAAKAPHDGKGGGDFSEVILAQHSGSDYYRIPSLTVATNGDLLASYDLRPNNANDSPNPNSIVQRRSKDNGATWGAQTVISRGVTTSPTEAYSDPSYVVDYETGKIFNFHVKGYSRNFQGSEYSLTDDGKVDEADRNSTQMYVAESSDNGYTWTGKTITDAVLSEGSRVGGSDGILSAFATSGDGIQMTRSCFNGDDCKGRLVQQYAFKVNGRGSSYYAASLYSDDHGVTWHLGALAPATGLDGNTYSYDENKVVELEDGRLMLNSRAGSNYGQGYRVISYSEDGGKTWSAPLRDEELRDGVNNAHLIRAYPTAKPGSEKSKTLIFSYSPVYHDRTQGTVRVSTDSGETWPVAHSKLFLSDANAKAGYTSMAVLKDGSIGILSETSDDSIRFQKFGLGWLGACPTPLVLAADTALTLPAGVPATLDDELFAVANGTAAAGDPGLKKTFEITSGNLPTGMSFDAATGVLSGTPTAKGTYAFALRVTEEEDGTGAAARMSMGSVTITVNDGALKTNKAINTAQAADDLAKLQKLVAGDEAVRWIFAGDSITQGVMHTKGLRHYTEYFNQMLHEEGVNGKPRPQDRVVNSGISSATTEHLEQYYDSLVPEKDPDVVFITYAMNDGRNDGSGNGVAAYKQRLAQAVAKVRDAGAIPILQTTNFTVQTSWDTNLERYYQAVRELAQEQGVILVDFSSYWKEINPAHGKDAKLLGDNSIHPSELGHLLWAQYIGRVLELSAGTELDSLTEAPIPNDNTNTAVQFNSVVQACVARATERKEGSVLDLPVGKYFTGANYIDATDKVQDLPALATKDSFTFVARFKAASGKGGALITLSDKDDPKKKIGLRLMTSGEANAGGVRLMRNFGGANETDNGYTRGSALADGQWHTVAAAVSNTALVMVVDGGSPQVIELSGNDVMPLTKFTPDTVTVGATQNQADGGVQASQYFTGSIDYVQVFDMAVSNAEMQALTAPADADANGVDLSSYVNTTDPDSWLFLGGATVAGATDHYQAKNFVEIMEEVVRWEYAGNPIAKRTKQVVNDGQAGYKSANLLARYQELAPEMVEITYVLPDVLDAGGEPVEELAEFKHNMEQLAAVATGPDGSKQLIFVTPATLGEKAAPYATALQEIAAADQSGKVAVIDLRGYLLEAQTMDADVATEWFTDGVANSEGQLAIGRYLLQKSAIPMPSSGKLQALHYDQSATSLLPQTVAGGVAAGERGSLIWDEDAKNSVVTIPLAGLEDRSCFFLEPAWGVLDVTDPDNPQPVAAERISVAADGDSLAISAVAKEQAHRFALTARAANAAGGDSITVQYDPFEVPALNDPAQPDQPDTPEQPDQPGGGDEPAQPDQPVKPDQPGEPSDPAQPAKLDQISKTGANMAWAALLALGMIAAGSVAVATGRRGGGAQ